jgi:hypothetical protein
MTNRQYYDHATPKAGFIVVIIAFLQDPSAILRMR